MSSRTETATHFVVTIPKAPEQVGIDRPSIRQICLEGLFTGRSFADIAGDILRYHPGSAPTTSAKKMRKHVGWYKSRMKTAGTPEHKWLLQQLEPATETPTETPTPEPMVEAPANEPVVEAQVETPTLDEADRLAAEVDARLAAQAESEAA